MRATAPLTLKNAITLNQVDVNVKVIDSFLDQVYVNVKLTHGDAVRVCTKCFRAKVRRACFQRRITERRYIS